LEALAVSRSGRRRTRDLVALSLALLAGAAAVAPAHGRTDDPSSPFYLLPTKGHGTTLHRTTG
jgi:hypothetical protein